MKIFQYFIRNYPHIIHKKTTGHTKVHSYTKHQDDGSNYGKTKIGISGGGSTERFPRDVQIFKSDKQKVSLHPTQKPVTLLEYLIKTYTNENEIVLDNCMGSGSTGVAAINTNRRFIGIEKDDNYFEIARNRIEECLNEKYI